MAVIGNLFSCLCVPFLSLTFFPLYHGQEWVPGPEVFSASCGSSSNRLVFCDTVGKCRDFELRHFHTSLLHLPITLELP